MTRGGRGLLVSDKTQNMLGKHFQNILQTCSLTSVKTSSEGQKHMREPPSAWGRPSSLQVEISPLWRCSGGLVGGGLVRVGLCAAPSPWPPALPCSLDPVSRQQSLRGPWRLLSHWSVLQ